MKFFSRIFLEHLKTPGKLREEIMFFFVFFFLFWTSKNSGEKSWKKYLWKNREKNICEKIVKFFFFLFFSGFFGCSRFEQLIRIMSINIAEYPGFGRIFSHVFHRIFCLRSSGLFSIWTLCKRYIYYFFNVVNFSFF